MQNARRYGCSSKTQIGAPGRRRAIRNARRIQLHYQRPALRAATREELYRRLHRAKEFIAASFEEPITIDEMAGVACLSTNHFLRTFRQAFRQTPHQFLTARRLERARNLLLHTDLPVTEICLSVGFESLGSFSSLFRRKFGASPEQFRRAKK